MKITLQNITKHFGEEFLFNDISLSFNLPSSTALLGINGSGKSTLLQIIANYVMPTKGEIMYEQNGNPVEPEAIFHLVSYCAPYLELIEEMTLIEFLSYHFSFKKTQVPIDEIIHIIGLEKAKHKLIEKFSSGMKQRVKLAQAIFADSPVLCLDEPCTNLDENGIQLYRDLIEKYARNKILIVASNDINEYDVCEHRIKIDEKLK